MAVDSDADRFSKWAVYVAMGAPAALFFDNLLLSFANGMGIVFGLHFIVFTTILIAFPIIAIVFVFISVSAIWRGRWRRVLSFSLLPIFSICTAIWPLYILPRIGWAADLTHYVMLRTVYTAKIDALPPSDEPRLVWFFWRDASALSGLTLVYLVFDESDEFSRPDDKRSAAWKARALRTFVKASGFPDGAKMPDKILHLSGHYYVVTLDW